jgi:hypothetical protein
MMATLGCGIAADSELVGSSLLCPAAAAPGHQGSPRHRVDKVGQQDTRQGTRARKPRAPADPGNPRKKERRQRACAHPRHRAACPNGSGPAKEKPGGPKTPARKSVAPAPGEAPSRRGAKDGDKRTPQERKKTREEEETTRADHTDRTQRNCVPAPLGHTQGTGQRLSARRRDSPQRGAQGHKSAGWRDPRAPRREAPKPPTAHQAKAQARAC